MTGVQTCALPILQVVPTNLVTSVAEAAPVVEAAPYVKPRGSFAEAVAQETEVKQELLDPVEVLKTPSNQPGLKRL